MKTITDVLAVIFCSRLIHCLIMSEVFVFFITHMATLLTSSSLATKKHFILLSKTPDDRDQRTKTVALTAWNISLSGAHSIVSKNRVMKSSETELEFSQQRSVYHAHGPFYPLSVHRIPKRCKRSSTSSHASRSTIPYVTIFPLSPITT